MTRHSLCVRSGYHARQQAGRQGRRSLCVRRRSAPDMPDTGGVWSGAGRSCRRLAAVPRSRPVKQKRAKRSWFGNLISTKSMGAEDYFDFDLLLVVIFLLGFGLVMLYSTSAYEAEVELGNDLYYFSRQALIGAVGFIIMIFISRIDYHIYGAFAAEIYAVAMVLMVLVKSPLGITLNGARRWIRLPGNLTLQPAEITKIAVILFIAYELCRLGRKAYKMEGVIQVFVFGAIASGGVLFLTDNLSTAIIVMAITCILIFVSHPKMKPFLIFIGVAAVIAVVGNSDPGCYCGQQR